MNKSILSRVATLENREGDNASDGKIIAVAGMVPLAMTENGISDFVATLGFDADVTLWIVERHDLSLAPVQMGKLDAAGEQIWLEASNSYPHAIVMVRPTGQVIVRIEDATSARAFHRMSLPDRADLSAADEQFIWVKPHELAA